MKEKLEERKERIAPGGRVMILAYDQGFEHGPRDFLENPESRSLEYVLDIAKRGGFTGIVLHAGLAEEYESAITDIKVPLILKLNGKSELYTEDDPYSPQLYSVADAITLVEDVLTAGAVGIAVGRNIWQRKDPLDISRKIHRLIFG